MLGNVTILVSYDAENDTTQTDLRCIVNNCGKQPSLESSGPKTVQQVVCLEVFYRNFLIMIRSAKPLG